jgi:dinuclear metal center YbgI/SA1388 family protein
MSVKRAVTTIQKLYPVAYSETAWDNTGLLLDSTSVGRVDSTRLRILLTIDLTQRVVQEAIASSVGLIIAYHPFLFKKFNKIEPSVIPQHDSLIKLIKAGISVYSPHTAVDSVRYGVNDWLIEGVSDKSNVSDIEIISPNKTNAEVGTGRVVSLRESIKLDNLLNGLKKHLGVENLLIGSTRKNYAAVNVKKVAICAGSGSGVFSQIQDDDVDVYLTGELSHHEGLALKEVGKVVILANHSNTERGYLVRMKELLEAEIKDADFIISKEDEDTYDFI